MCVHLPCHTSINNNLISESHQTHRWAFKQLKFGSGLVLCIVVKTDLELAFGCLSSLFETATNYPFLKQQLSGSYFTTSINTQHSCLSSNMSSLEGSMGTNRVDVMPLTGFYLFFQSCLTTNVQSLPASEASKHSKNCPY